MQVNVDHASNARNSIPIFNEVTCAFTANLTNMAITLKR